MICLLEFEISNHINCMCGGRWKGMPFNHNIPLQWIILHFPHWVVFELYHIKIGLPQCMLGWRLQKSPATSPPNLFFGTARHTDLFGAVVGSAPGHSPGWPSRQRYSPARMRRRSPVLSQGLAVSGVFKPLGWRYIYRFSYNLHTIVVYFHIVHHSGLLYDIYIYTLYNLCTYIYSCISFIWF